MGNISDDLTGEKEQHTTEERFRIPIKKEKTHIEKEKILHEKETNWREMNEFGGNDDKIFKAGTCGCGTGISGNCKEEKIKKCEVIELDDVIYNEEEEIWKHPLGLYTLYKARWNDKYVFLRIVEEKLLNTKKFNIFHNLEAELSEIVGFDHPNILTYEAYSELPDVGVVTEYCENGTLSEYLENMSKKNNFLQEEKILKILLGIAEGMDYLHKKNIIHRALRPDSIFLTEDLEVKIDFGFTRTFDQSIFRLDRAYKELSRIGYKVKDEPLFDRYKPLFHIFPVEIIHIIDSFSYHPGKYSQLSAFAAPEVTIFDQIEIEYDDELPFHEEFYTKEDIFGFGILVFVVATGIYNPYDNDMFPVWKKSAQKRPKFGKYFRNEGLKKLAINCWKHKAMERPSFEKIVNILKNLNPNCGD